MAQSEIIVDVGAEGGSLTIYGNRTKGGWLFSRDVIDQSMLLEDEPESRHSSEVVSTWAAALLLLDRYPWHMLYPLKVHPEFQKLVYGEIIKRFKKEPKNSQRRLPDWKEICGVKEI